MRGEGLQLPNGSLKSGFIHSLDENGSIVKKKLNSVTDSLQFKRWFGNSKVKNADGTPKVMYRGGAETINIIVPIKINNDGQYNRIMLNANRIKTVFWKIEFHSYIRREISHGNLVRVKKRGNQVSELNSPIKNSYNKVVSTDSISLGQVESQENLSSKGEADKPDTKFSLKAPVEEKKDLVAVHNFKTADLRIAATFSGLSLPSIDYRRLQTRMSRSFHQRIGSIPFRHACACSFRTGSSIAFCTSIVSPRSASAHRIVASRNTKHSGMRPIPSAETSKGPTKNI